MIINDLEICNTCGLPMSFSDKPDKDEYFAWQALLAHNKNPSTNLNSRIMAKYIVVNRLHK